MLAAFLAACCAGPGALSNPWHQGRAETGGVAHRLSRSCAVCVVCCERCSTPDRAAVRTLWMGTRAKQKRSAGPQGSFARTLQQFVPRYSPRFCKSSTWPRCSSQRLFAVEYHLPKGNRGTLFYCSGLETRQSSRSPTREPP